MARIANMPGNGLQRGPIRLTAPADATQSSSLLRLLSEVREHIHRGRVGVVIDLSTVRLMNARLLATLLLIAREVTRTGGMLHLDGPTDDFRRWAETFGLLQMLERRGLLSA